MFERFTERARNAVVLAQGEARGLKHDYIGTEHLLLGLLREEDGLAARTLGGVGLVLADVRASVGSANGEEVATGQIPFTKHAKRALETALLTANRWGHGFVGTEHLLAGLLADPSSRAVSVLAASNLQPATVAERLFATMQFTDPAGEASSYAPAAAQTDEEPPVTDGPYTVGDA
jgi:ATP-dependent Clp protease ATP-binding subunit ClpC